MNSVAIANADEHVRIISAGEDHALNFYKYDHETKAPSVTYTHTGYTDSVTSCAVHPI